MTYTIYELSLNAAADTAAINALAAQGWTVITAAYRFVILGKPA